MNQLEEENACQERRKSRGGICSRSRFDRREMLPQIKRGEQQCESRHMSLASG